MVVTRHTNAVDSSPRAYPGPFVFVLPSLRVAICLPSKVSDLANSTQLFGTAVVFFRRSPFTLSFGVGTAAFMFSANGGSGYLHAVSTSPVQGTKYTLHVTVGPFACSGASLYTILFFRSVMLVLSKLLWRL